ncbi:hypothetical protein Fmac_015909 [Flemingia macrophylla]|uniref:Leucine-rich repeat-containing N-terminal plant-type domain-containing protein n=1 Tax=Flemingia macrophylla TaxID=520843 RepID=A0ABD1MG19_9FABA
MYLINELHSLLDGRQRVPFDDTICTQQTKTLQLVRWDTPLCIPSERETLLKFKHHLRDPFNRLSSWNNASANPDCCHWLGVVCSNVTAHVAELHLNTTPPDPVDYPFDSEGYEKALDVTQVGGEINPCMADLKHLNYLNLSHNFLLGKGFQSYLNLRGLSLFVENVDWLSRLSKLEHLDMRGANLSKAFHWLHTLQALPSLMHLHLSQCTLPVPHDSQSYTLNFSSLLTLDMSYVYYPFFPKWVLGLTKAFSIELSGNNIQGPIPDGIQNITFLQNLDLSNNSFSSSIPDSLCSLHHLKFLRLQQNILNGSISNVLGNLTSLIVLDLSSNSQLEGTISTSVEWQLGPKFPSWIQSQNKLQYLEMSNAGIFDSIPSGFWKTTSQAYFENLSHNYIHESSLSVFLWLKGTEDEYKNFLGLVTSIDLSNNKLSGEIPRKITNLNGLTFLNLSHNQLIGHIPQRIGNMKSLLSIDFSRNQLSGVIPPTISNLSFLSVLDLSYNNLKGKIPTGTQLQTFDASKFIGNWLCGPPLPVNCSSNGTIHSYDHKGEGSHRHGGNWLFVCMTFGFIVGFWIVVGPLFICRSWRYAYFDILDYVWFKLQSFC